MTDEQQDRDWAASPNHHLIESSSSDFPALLKQISGAPQRLYVIGNLDALHLPSLAIVGSRNPTEQGRQNAYEFAKHLGHSGFCIVSGLAQGIDTAAHVGALDGGAMTVAFLGHGIDQIYPAANSKLAGRIAAQGVICSEFPLGAQPRREHFPQRNRLISGLSLGTLVVEAARRSGSLISARLAAEAEQIARKTRAYNPVPGAWFEFGGERIKCWKASVLQEAAGESGVVLQAGKDGIDVACGTEAVRIHELQRPGRRRISAGEFASQVSIAGARLG